MGIFNNIIILQKFQMQSGIPNHYPKFSKLHQFAYIIEPHHQKKGRCDQRKLGHQPHPNIGVCGSMPVIN